MEIIDTCFGQDTVEEIIEALVSIVSCNVYTVLILFSFTTFTFFSRSFFSFPFMEQNRYSVISMKKEVLYNEIVLWSV